MTDLIVRPTIQDLWLFKLKYLSKMKDLENLDNEFESMLTEYGGHKSFRIQWDYNIQVNGHNIKWEERNEKYIDKVIWNYLIQSYQLDKYMLCTEYAKLQKEIDDYQAPTFNIINATGWMAALKETVYNNIEQLVLKVYDELINGYYFTGVSYNSRKKKKRNNGKVQKHFILSVGDYSSLKGAYWKYTTFTDDLEKACYLISGKRLPEITIRRSMVNGNTLSGENEFMRIKVYATGNTHYTLSDDIVEKFNLLSDNRNKIGEDIDKKIKIFD